MSYWPNNDWITISPAALNGDARAAIVDGLALATTQPVAFEPCRVPPCGERRWRAKATQRGVEIMVKYLNMSTREAVDRYAASFVARSTRPSVAGHNMPRGIVSPCYQLDDLWFHFEISDPKPACPPGGSK